MGPKKIKNRTRWGYDCLKLLRTTTQRFHDIENPRMRLLSPRKTNRRRKWKKQRLQVFVSRWVLFFALVSFVTLDSNTFAVHAAQKCGNLKCFVSPGVEKFAVRCRKASALSLSDHRSSSEGAGISNGFEDVSSAISPVLVAGKPTRCRPAPRQPSTSIEENVKDMGIVWDFTVTGRCKSNSSPKLGGIADDGAKVQLLDMTKQEPQVQRIDIDVCVPASKTRFLTFDMRGGLGEQLMSLVYASHIAQRLGFVLALPKFIDARRSDVVPSTEKTNAHLDDSMSRRVVPLSDLFDVPALQENLASAKANYARSLYGNPEQPGLQHVRLDVPRYSNYVEYMDKIGKLAVAGDGLVVDAGDLFLRLNAASCEIQDELASLLDVITSSFRKEIVDSSGIIVEKLKNGSLTSRRKRGNFNAIDLSSSSLKSSSLAFSGTRKNGQIKKSGFRARSVPVPVPVPVYVACVGWESCASDLETGGYNGFYSKSSFRNLVPRSLQDLKLGTAALDFLVLAQSSKFSGSALSVFSHLIVTVRKGRESFEIDDESFSKPFTEAAASVEHNSSYGSFSPRQPCKGLMDENIIATAADRHYARDVIDRRRSHLRNHGVDFSPFTDALVALELSQQGETAHGYSALQIATGFDATGSESPRIQAQKACSLIEEQNHHFHHRRHHHHYHHHHHHHHLHHLPLPLLGYPLQRHLGISCPSTGTKTLLPPRVLFVSHNLRLEGAPLVMTFLIEYLVKVLLLKVDVLAPENSCNEPLRVVLLDLGVRQVMCQRHLDPRGYDAIYLNTIVSWFELPSASSDKEKNSWLERTIWWVHESARDAFSYLPNTAKLFPLVRSRIFVSSATRSVYSDLGQGRDWTIYNALDAEGTFWNTTVTSLRERTRTNVLKASPEETVFVLSGTVAPPRHQLEFVRAAGKLMRDDPAVAPLCRFVLIGFTGEYPDVEKAVKDVAARSGFPEKFMFFERKQHAEAVKLLTAADVVVSVSDKESFGMALLEGMTAGLAAIVQRVDGLPEVVYEGGIDIDPKNIDSFSSAMRSMLQPSVRLEHGARAAQRSAFFGKGAFYTKHVLALREVVESLQIS